MSLFGTCVDCGEGAQLQYKPDVPLSQQSRPSVCLFCKGEREHMMNEPREQPPIYTAPVKKTEEDK